MKMLGRFAFTFLGVVLAGAGCAALATAVLDPSPQLPRAVAVVVGVVLLACSYAVNRSSTIRAEQQE